MWYLGIFILLLAYMLEAGGAGYWAAKKEGKKALKKGFGALIYFLSIVFIITHFLV